MGKRMGAHGEGTWSIPGGHLEYGESFADTARREVLEETGVAICNVRFGAVTNDVFAAEQKHYVTIWMLSEYESGTPEVKEPDKYIEQGWFDFDTLPEPLFFPWKQLLASPFITQIRTAL